MCRDGHAAFIKSVELVPHYTFKEHIFHLCSVFIYACFSKALVNCLCGFHTCLGRYQSCEGFVLYCLVHIHVNCVCTFSHTGRTAVCPQPAVYPFSESAFGQKRRDKWKCITKLCSWHSFPSDHWSHSPSYTHRSCLFYFLYLAIPGLKLQHVESLVAAYELLVATWGI